jgi:hypothetical protein
MVAADKPDPLWDGVGEGASAMFNWTQERTLAAMAAGVPEVTSAYNEAYAYATTDLTVGPDNGNAHDYALRAVTKSLRAQEDALFEKHLLDLVNSIAF